ncbi:MAG: type II toxin-antitoxin system RelB/DinJ family antitoxin [Oscillospiraceae bacterium]|nr:type II toxin-antitoxin system RelB/DinJ family antitoxin [Oscillospiraceae bacterium]
MAKTIQVRVDDNLKDSADMLFSSLGLDTSTAVRMFLVAAMERGGIPFPVMHNSDPDYAVKRGIAERQAGEPFLSSDDFLANMRTAINKGKNYD